MNRKQQLIINGVLLLIAFQLVTELAQTAYSSFGGSSTRELQQAEEATTTPTNYNPSTFTLVRVYILCVSVYVGRNFV